MIMAATKDESKRETEGVQEHLRFPAVKTYLIFIGETGESKTNSVLIFFILL